MHVKEIRSARIRTVAKKFSAVQTGTQLLPAPGVSRWWVIDFFFINMAAAGAFELKAGADAAWADYDSVNYDTAGNGSGLAGGNFGANGGFVSGYDLEAPVNSEIRFTSTGTPGTHYVVISAHIEE